MNHLTVKKDGRTVMDIQFHKGLNIIAGENSSGKTTAIRFIAFALGAENISFHNEALLCDTVYLEIEANKTVITLSRKVSNEIMRPLAIFWGGMKMALAAGASHWQLFPFKRSESKKSFSQVIFQILELPELRGEGGSNITMHQLLRLIYSDQETPHSEIFRHDRFDRGITRAAVGDYLLGVDSTELYELKLREAEAEKEVNSFRTSIKTIYRTFGKSGAQITLDFLDNQIQTLGSEISFLYKKLEGLNESETFSKFSSSKEDNNLRERLNQAHSNLSRLKQARLDLQAEISDSELFIKEMEERLLSLEESSIAESYLGTAVFSFCPSCFSKLESASDATGACALCKSAIAEDSAKSQLVRMKNELTLQLNESGKIRQQQLEELDALMRDIPAAEGELKLLETVFKKNQSVWRSPNQIEMQSVSKEIGAKEQEIKNALELKKLADLLNQLSESLSRWERDLELIRGSIQAESSRQKARRTDAYLAVAKNLKVILKEDLFRQEEFFNADEVDIDFGANQLTIDENRFFSASSTVFLRHGFHLALLLTSLELNYFRYPRLLMIDGIEDGGMESDRSHNFQEIIARHSAVSVVEHQIIMTTTDISPKLDTEAYLVGRKFTPAEKSIDIR